MKPKCEDCRYWERENDWKSGICKRYPPFLPQWTGYGTEMSLKRQCWTGEHDWCREFKEKEEENGH